MKSIKIIISILVLVIASTCGTLIGLTIWANKPRGVKIDLSKLDSIY